MSGVTAAVMWWTQLYASNDVVQLASAGGHILSISYAASFALRGDRAALRLTSVSRRPIGDITTITRAHRHVITGLAFAIFTGLAQLAAQLDYLPQSPIFWVKMLMLACLLANGRIIQLAGRQYAATTEAPMLRAAAIRSIALWCGMVVMGLLLTTVRP